MNRPLLGRLASTLFFFYVLAFAGFAAWVFFTFSADSWLPGFRTELALKRGFLLWMDYLLPVHAAAVAVAASLAGAQQGPVLRGEAAPPFGRIVSSTLVVFLLLTAAFAVLSEGIYPRAARRVSDMRYQTRLARVYLAEARTSLAAKDYVSAVDQMKSYLLIDPGNKEVQDAVLQAAAGAAHQVALKPAQPVAPVIDPTDSAQALLDKAKAAFDRHDYFAAHSYAQAANTLDPRRTDALRLSSQAWDALGQMAATETDQARAALFRQKKDAYALLTSNPIAAYYQFQALAARYPRDTDIQTYLAKAAQLIAAEVFFLNEAKTLEPLPGTQDILFLNTVTRTATEAVFIGKMVELPDGTAYFYDIEAIRYDSTGAVAWHFSAPYGKRTADAASGTGTLRAVMMHGVDRSDSRLQARPVYLQGSRPAAERDVLLLTPTIEELHALSSGADAPAAMSITDLLRLRNDLGLFGLARPAFTIEMAMKMVMPFIYLIVSMFAVSLGWGFRARGRLPVFGIIVIPAIPVVMAVLTLLYVHAHRIIAGFAVLALGLPAALVLLGVLQLALLAGALVTLAGQTTR
jgi:hypothetical protein